MPVSYEQSAITYVWKNDEDTLRKSPSLTTLNAYLIQNQTIPCPIKASWRGKIYDCSYLLITYIQHINIASKTLYKRKISSKSYIFFALYGSLVTRIRYFVEAHLIFCTRDGQRLPNYIEILINSFQLGLDLCKRLIFMINLFCVLLNIYI